MKILQVLILIVGFVISLNAQTAVLSGSVYDPNGAVVSNAKVTAINQNGKQFEAITNSEGIYQLTLPFNVYDTKNTESFRISSYAIIAQSDYFELFILRDFKFVPSTKGKMNLDIALEVARNPEPCGYGGVCPKTPNIETPKIEVSDKILQRPLEELPKEQNKTKRKIKNNKQ